MFEKRNSIGLQARCFGVGVGVGKGSHGSLERLSGAGAESRETEKQSSEEVELASRDSRQTTHVPHSADTR